MKNDSYSSKSSFIFRNRVLKYNKVIASPNKRKIIKMEVIGSNNGNNPTINIIDRITYSKYIITFIRSIHSPYYKKI